MMEALIHRYAGMPVPRYTSYPTAVEFSAAVGPPEKARWLEILDRAAPVSLYVHVCPIAGTSATIAAAPPRL